MVDRRKDLRNNNSAPENPAIITKKCSFKNM
jgi:hypothetical protein